MNVQIIGDGNITNKNFNASFLINNNILVDSPPGVLKKLKSLDVNIDNITIIIITHLHGDHFFDLPFIILHEYSKKRTKPLFIIGPKELKKDLSKLIKLAFKNRLNKYLSKLNITFIDSANIQNHEVEEGVFLSSVRVNHGNLKNCYGFLLKKDNKSLSFTGDTEMCPGLTYLLKRSSHCIIDVNNSGNHLKLEQLENLIKEFPINYIPIHYPENLENKLSGLSNIKLIKSGEQFYL
ncbi:MAG: MBL fold metallo-hydrolase [Bacilli bacterium]|nr:MBL fold metallo-hydrolase [Bacilli bacterium]